MNNGYFFHVSKNFKFIYRRYTIGNAAKELGFGAFTVVTWV